MAKTMAAFYELPPWFEKMNQLQRQIDSLTRPLLEMQTDYAALTKTIAAVLDLPAIRDLNKVSRVFDNQSMAAIYRTQEIISKMDTSGITAALRQYQAVMDAIAPMDMQIQLNECLQEWFRIMFKATCRIKPLTETRIAELTRLSSLAEEYSATDISEGSRVLSKGEQKIVADEVEEILLSGRNWEQRFAERIKEFSQTHPVIAWVLEKIFFAILISVAANIVYSAVGQALSPAKVYETPSPSSQVIYHMERNQNAIIVGEVPYYYEVVINDNSPENCYTGYVSKRSICLTDIEDNTTEANVR